MVYILSKTLLPMLNVHDDYPIPDLAKHAIMKLVNGLPLDFEDCFIRVLVSCAADPASLKPYAPWLMSLCNYSREVPFPSTKYPSIFTQPVREIPKGIAR